MKKITFISDTRYPQEWLIEPQPASNFIPDWYRNGEMFWDKKNLSLEIESDISKVAGLKACIPFLDGLSSGYMLTTWAAIEVTRNDENVLDWHYLDIDEKGKYYVSSKDYNMIERRPDIMGATIPRPAGHAFAHMSWKSRWGIKVPRGWSVIFTHPLNHFELPFTTVSAIMDSDRFSARGNAPFFIKEGFTGIIPKNTPYAQIIPVKRSSWMSFYRKMNNKELYVGNASRNVKYGFYRSRLWVPKRYDVGEKE